MRVALRDRYLVAKSESAPQRRSDLRTRFRDAMLLKCWLIRLASFDNLQLPPASRTFHSRSPGSERRVLAQRLSVPARIPDDSVEVSTAKNDNQHVVVSAVGD